MSTTAQQAACEYLDATDSDPLAVAKVRALVTGYHEHWQSAPYEVLAVEEVFRLPIVNPETGRPSRTYMQAGRFDLRVGFDRKKWMVEHKTSSEEIADPAAAYWKRLAIDQQVSMYALAHWQNEEKLDGTIYDVIRKPTIRPKQITKSDQKVMTEQKIYCGFSIDNADISFAAANENVETPALYGLRLLRDCLDSPTKYYQRRPIPRLDNEILEWSGELWQVAQDIRATELSGGHYRNSGACMNYGRPCDFLGICSGYDTPDSDKWRKREHVNSEIQMGAEVLTHSRIRCYQTCKRLHHYRYGLGIERADDETAEALLFGQLLHKCLEAYYLFMKDNQDEYSNGTPAATEVAGGTQTLAF